MTTDQPGEHHQGTRGRAVDAALIERSRSDPEVFSGLIDRHGPAVDRYVRYRLGDDVADDVVADTFLTAFGNRDRYDLDRDDARPWLYGIASKLIRRHQRAEQRAYRAVARLAAERTGEPFTERVHDKVVAGSAKPRLAAALGAMSAKNREVLLLIAWADLSYEETALALDIPVGTVRSRLNRARRHIRAALGHTDPTTAEELHHG